MTAAAVAASSAREIVLVIPMPFGFTQTQEPSSSHAAASTFKVCARKRNLLILRITCLEIPWYIYRHTLISRERDGTPRMIGGQFVVVRVGVH